MLLSALSLGAAFERIVSEKEGGIQIARLILDQLLEKRGSPGNRAIVWVVYGPAKSEVALSLKVGPATPWPNLCGQGWIVCFIRSQGSPQVEMNNGKSRQDVETWTKKEAQFRLVTPKIGHARGRSLRWLCRNQRGEVDWMPSETGGIGLALEGVRSKLPSFLSRIVNITRKGIKSQEMSCGNHYPPPQTWNAIVPAVSGCETAFPGKYQVSYAVHDSV